MTAEAVHGPSQPSSIGKPLWTGSGEPPPGHVRLDAVACNSLCYPDYHECVEPGVAVALQRLGEQLCTHTEDPHAPCRGCGMALRELAELGRGSIAWDAHDGSIVGSVHWSLELWAQAGILDRADAEARIDAFDDDRFDDVPYLNAALDGAELTWQAVRSFITLGHDTSGRSPFHFATGGIWPRDEEHKPPRGGYHRAEAEIAKRKGWPQPQRFMLEEKIRAAAVASHNEANFVRLCTENNVLLVPKTGAPHLGVVAYSAQLLDIPAADRVTYGGMNLAKDLALNALRDIQWEEPATVKDAAWATWMALCSDVAALESQPAPRTDGRWRWILPEVAGLDLADVAPLGKNPARAEVIAYLGARQGDVCAMCQIRRRGWTATTGLPIPPELLGPALNLDHDHATGLVRGLLCTPCNSGAEPAGIVTGEDVWRTYVSEPPIGEHSIVYRQR